MVRVGLIGRGIQLSRTPFMHETEGRRQGLDYSYCLIDLDEPEHAATNAAQALASVENQGFAGVNVTFPFKQSIMEHVHDVSEAAQAVGAANTIVFRKGRRIGHNTDVTGFDSGFRRCMKGRRLETVLLLGAGGAGGAVAHALLEYGVGTLLILDTLPDQATALTERLRSRFGGKARVQTVEQLEDIAGSLDGIVNATPVGMAKSPGCPFPKHLLSGRIWVADVIYFPLETELLAAARKAGCLTMSGAEMAIFQAAHAFELFTGLQADSIAMRASFDAYDDVAGS